MIQRKKIMLLLLTSAFYMVCSASVFANPSDTTSIIMENETVQRSLDNARSEAENRSGIDPRGAIAAPPVARPFNPGGVNPPNPSGFNPTSPAGLTSPNPSAFNPSSP